MRVTSLATAFGAVVVGIIIADILTHPTGTQQAANGIANITSPAYNALLGVPSSGQLTYAK